MKLFLKGEKCFSAKCPMVRKPYPPGKKGKRRKGSLSEYGIQLREKQRLKKWYNLREKQFKNYVKKVLAKRGQVEDASKLLIKMLELRLDNVVYRLGLASSKAQARQMVSHSYFLVNGRASNIPSRQLKMGDIVSLKEGKKKKAVFKNIKNSIQKYNPPAWLELDKEKLEGKVKGEPALEDTVPAEISAIFEFYSR